MITKLQYTMLKHIQSTHIDYTFDELSKSLSITSGPEYYDLSKAYDDLWHQNLLFVSDTDECGNYRFFICTQGVAALEEYELEQKSKLTVPEQANKIAKESNEIAKDANKKSSRSNVLSIIAIILSAGSLLFGFIKWIVELCAK